MDCAGSGRIDASSEADKDRLIEELRDAVRARDEFVAIAAHELRNPMTPILIQVDSLLAAVQHPERCRAEFLEPRLEILVTAARQFVRRATSLLDVSRIASGNVRIELEEVDFSAVMGRVVSHARDAARLARCDLKVDLQNNATGLWDRLALEQVGENIVSNAIKFGAGEPIDITLRASDGAAHLTVRDRGIGISQEDRERVFQRFERAVTSREHGGFGIGLWLAQQLVQAMHGTIAIDSAPGGGTVFTVTLPINADAPKGADDA